MGWPYPSGTLVLCRTPHGVPVRTSCRTHIFRTITEPEAVDYALGWIQAARCLVCDYVSQAIMADFWMYEAKQADCVRCIEDLMREGKRLGQVVAEIQHLAAGDQPATLKNFD